MKYLLVGVNSKYLHTNLAVRKIKDKLCDTQIYETSVNQNKKKILNELLSKDTQIYCFSMYIWNRQLVIWLCKNIKSLKPKSEIIIGGPEAEFSKDEILKEMPFAKIVTAYEFCGLEFPDKGIHYTEEEIERYKLLYYEGSRGCPFNCSYCMSSIDKKLVVRDENEVISDMKYFAQKGARVIKFCDRTFNADKERALRIWRALADFKSGTMFHFEICAELLDEKTLEFLGTVKKNRFQFEIGVQSINDKTLKEINRNQNCELALRNIKRLYQNGNIHIHTDIIAGLPYEGFNDVNATFDELFDISDVVQLGFLKLLHGTKIREEKDKHGYIFDFEPPYEVFCNNYISYEEMNKLKDVENMLDKFYKFPNSIKYLRGKFGSAFKMFCQLSDFYKSNNEPKGTPALAKILVNFNGNDILPTLRLDGINSL